MGVTLLIYHLPRLWQPVTMGEQEWKAGHIVKLHNDGVDKKQGAIISEMTNNHCLPLSSSVPSPTNHAISWFIPGTSWVGSIINPC